MKKAFIFITLLVLSFASTLAFVGCDKADAAQTIAEWKSKYTAGDFGIRDEKDPFVELELSNGDSIRLELYPDVAPISVVNFMKYVKDGFYDGVVFHRIIKGFMIQTGGFEEKDGRISQKTATYPAIKGEFAANGVTNNLSHTRGVLSMARTSAYDTATSQIFICSEITAQNTRGLNGSYAAFGKVIDEESMQAVSKLEKVETAQKTLYYGSVAQTSSDVPVDTVYIKKATLYQVD